MSGGILVRLLSFKYNFVKCCSFHSDGHKLRTVPEIQTNKLQWNFDGSNTDGSFTTAVLNSFLESLGKKPYSCRFGLT